jgi:hypothetical protein
MIIRALDTDFDFTFGKGIQNYLREIDALKLNLQTRLKSWKGDCFYAVAEGVDYNNFLDVGTKEFLDRDIKRVILQTEGVLKITEYESNLERDEREISISATILTIFGIGQIQI